MRILWNWCCLRCAVTQAGRTYRIFLRLRCVALFPLLGGLRDNEVAEGEIEAWSRHTVGPFQVHMFAGTTFS
jgi:surfactin synthase thioesterase subunit